MANEVPVEFWPILKAANERARAANRPLTVLILSEEPYVPWELRLRHEHVCAKQPATGMTEQRVIVFHSIVLLQTLAHMPCNEW